MRRSLSLFARLAVETVGVALAMGITACGGGHQASLQAPAGLAYPHASVQAIVGQVMVPNTPTVTGAGVSFSISPGLPKGMRFDPQTGTIDGTPIVPTAEATYTVTAANAAGATRTSLQLFVAGFVPDLRFQWTGAFTSYQVDGASYGSGTPPDGAQGITMIWNGLVHWGPLRISSPTGDGWGCYGFGVDFPLVGGTRSFYIADHLAVLDERLDNYISLGMVITSLDLGVRGFAVVATGPKDSASEYSSTRSTVASLAELSAWAATQGQLGGVLTALATPGKTYANAPGSGQVLAISTTRASAGATFETIVVSGTPAELSQQLPDLGQQGYVITAFGAGDQATYIAVGTRPTGTTTPHVIRVDGFGSAGGPAFQEGYVLAGRMSDLGWTTTYNIYQR